MTRASRANLVFRIALQVCLAALALFVGLFLLSSFLYAGPSHVLSLLARSEALHSIWLSVWTSTLATILALAFGVPAAYALARHPVRGGAVLDVLLDLPIVLPPLVAGFGLLLVYALADRALGERALDRAGLDLRFTRPGIVLAQFTIAAPLAVRVLRATFADVPVRAEKMARSLGCTEPEAFARVSLPMARNGILAGTILVWARSVAEFGPILVFAGAVRGKTDVLPIAIFLSFSNGEIENGVALSALLVVLGAVALVGIRRLGGRLVVG
jgi:molybdate transport system permease protein